MEKTGDGGFAGSRSTDDGDGFALGDGEGDAVEDGDVWTGRVGEVDVGVGDGARDGRAEGAVGFVEDGGGEGDETGEIESGAFGFGYGGDCGMGGEEKEGSG